MGIVSGPVPPRCLIIAADWCNILAGVSLVISFAIIASTYTFKWILPTDKNWHFAMQVTMTAEGVLWALAAGMLTRVQIIMNNAALAVGQTIICFGGIFFAISGLYDGVPGKVISLPYVLAPSPSVQDCAQGEEWTAPVSASFADACPYYGITCFMVATAMGLKGVWPLPKNRIVSPFWAVACFFIGAWTIGVISLWGPTLLDGAVVYEEMENPKVEMYSQKTFAWAWTHVFQVIGAAFLTAGGVIFAIMDGVLGCGGPSDNGIEDSDYDEDSCASA
ncbi:unnamed protein product [Durusdinium trenchii]|uniref:Uncharacterized protein n=2 Tax=Durusdinium trenchii TaxID=1381693 RepID=A0ABP0MHR7_9DINO